jgi:Flp pilus assembly protein TadG
MRHFLKRFWRDERGAAALELAAVGTLFIIGGLNSVDVGSYAYQTSEVNAAAQAGAQAALLACDLVHTPATLNCPGLTGAVTTAVRSTRLGSQATLDGPITEGYYCLDTSGALQFASPASSKPQDCSAIANPASSATPTLYLQVRVTSSYQPLFPGITVTQGFASSIKRTAWMRMA